MSANTGHSGQEGHSTLPVAGGVTNAVNVDINWWTRQEEVKDFGPNSRRTLAEYRRDCKGTEDAEHFSAMVFDGDSLARYDQNSFQYDIALGAWKRR